MLDAGCRKARRATSAAHGRTLPPKAHCLCTRSTLPDPAAPGDPAPVPTAPVPTNPVPRLTILYRTAPHCTVPQYADSRTYNMVVSVCVAAGDLKGAMHAADMARAAGLKPDTVLYTNLIKGGCWGCWLLA